MSEARRPNGALRSGRIASGPFEVAVVGAGVVGCAIARELTLRGASCALLDAAADVGSGTSKANTAILHTGFDTKPGTLEANLVPRGYRLLSAYADRVGIPAEVTGALLVAWTPEQREQLPRIAENARAVGWDNLRQVSPDELYRREPALGPGAEAALEVPSEGILCPFTATLALATEAVLGGCALFLDAPVTGLARADGPGGPLHRLRTPRGDLDARFLVNAAGLRSDEVDALVGPREFNVTPRRGELIVYDKLARGLLNHVLLPVPTAKTKGVLVSPTAYGNVLLGPTADDVSSKTDTGTTGEGLEALLAQGERILPGLADHEVTATYAGLRAATEESDYRLRFEPDRRYVCAGGIRSTGVSGSMAIAEHVREGLADAGVSLAGEIHEVDLRMPNIGAFEPRPYERDDEIAADPDRGRIVCFCERTTRGEIAAAMDSPIPPADLDGLRRRTRALMGRCQGFFCAAELTEAMERGRA